jgi:Concanavalin A-like lectin/glucanases superfamily
VAATYDGAMMKLYINGVLEASTPTNRAVLNDNANPIEIGGSTEYRNYYPGCVDDVRIFCTNLTADTVLALFNGSIVTPPPPPPVNTPPVMSDIPNITMITNTTSLELPFTTSDGQTPNAALVVTATSDNPTLLPNANIFLANYISNRVVQVTPAPDQAGFCTVTVTVSDGALSTNDTFTVSVMAPVPPTTGCLISHWNFNEASGNTALDAVNGNSGTLIGSPVRAPGLSGGALFFNGENNYVNVPDSDSLDLTNQFSISLWFQPGTLLNGGSGRRDLLQKFLSYWFIINYPGNDGRLAFVLNSGAPLVKSTTASWTAGQWYHAVSTYDGIQLKLYINGVLEASAPASVLPVKNTSPLLIGGNISQVSYFPGGLDEVRLYGCALTAGDITGLYEQGGSTTPPPPNTPPTISDIADRSIAANSNTGDIPFTVNDAQTSPGSLVVTATSGNTTLVPNANLLLGGSAGARTLRVTPSPGLTGSALITVTVSDGALATNDTFLLTVTNAPPPPPLGTNTLISRWLFDEPDSLTALDLAGLNHGSLVNGPLRIPGTIGSGALQFDGSNDHVNVPDSTSLDLSNRFTIAFWFKPSVLLNGTSGRKDLLQKFLSYWILLNYPANDGRLSFVLNSGSPYARSTTTTWNANQWYHLAATYDGVTMKLFINGVLEGTAPTTLVPANTANPLQIGGNTTQGYWFPGALDDVRLYGSPLAADAIAAVMSGFQPLRPPGGLTTTSPTMTITAETENDLVVLKWPAQAGRSYRVEYTEDLATGDWTALPGEVTVNGTTARAEDTLGLSTQRFYRVVIEP